MGVGLRASLRAWISSCTGRAWTDRAKTRCTRRWRTQALAVEQVFSKHGCGRGRGGSASKPVCLDQLLYRQSLDGQSEDTLHSPVAHTGAGIRAGVFKTWLWSRQRWVCEQACVLGSAFVQAELGRTERRHAALAGGAHRCWHSSRCFQNMVVVEAE